jgi:hypothetical protein
MDVFQLMGRPIFCVEAARRNLARHGEQRGAGTLKFLVPVIIAGFLFSPGPLLVAATKTLALRIDSTHGEEFVEFSGATRRAVSRGVIGISLFQAVTTIQNHLGPAH